MKKNLLGVSGITSLLLVGVFGFNYYTKPPVIETTKIELSYGEKFKIDKEIDTKKEVVSKKIVKGKVDTSKIGQQEITVEVENSHGITAQKQITVNVVDLEAPSIEVQEEFTIEAKQPFDLKGQIKATDNVDGDLIDAIQLSDYQTERVQQQMITISVTDSSQNKSQKEISLHVVDTTKPVITATSKEITEGENIDLKKNVTATDSVDGDLTGKIEVFGTVDSKKAGQYKVTYKVKDEAGNEASSDIQVTVKKKPVPQVPVQNKVSIKSTKSQPTNSSYAPMTIYFNGKGVSYANGGKSSGQSIIDGSRKASTWGGASVFSGSDGMNTHFIGHNPGNFTGIWNAKTFIITDGNGTPYTYHVTSVYKVNDQGVRLNDGVDRWDQITGTGGGERVTFQTCINDSTNYIIEASISN